MKSEQLKLDLKSSKKELDLKTSKMMAKNEEIPFKVSGSKIQWTNNTVNFWQGCKKITAGCKYC